MTACPVRRHPPIQHLGQLLVHVQEVYQGRVRRLLENSLLYMLRFRCEGLLSNIAQGREYLAGVCQADCVTIGQA